MANKGTNKPLAAIYGQALFEAACDAGVQDRVASELTALTELIEKDARIGIFLETPTIAFADKRKVIESSFAAFTAITRNFLLVIAEHGRTTMLNEIVHSYHAHANIIADIAVVEVRTARALEANEREQIIKVMGSRLNKKIELEEHVNPDLIGGVVLVHEDTMWDGSLRRKLDDAIKVMEIKTNLVKWTE